VKIFDTLPTQYFDLKVTFGLIKNYPRARGDDEYTLPLSTMFERTHLLSEGPSDPATVWNNTDPPCTIERTELKAFNLTLFSSRKLGRGERTPASSEASIGAPSSKNCGHGSLWSSPNRKFTGDDDVRGLACEGQDRRWVKRRRRCAG